MKTIEEFIKSWYSIKDRKKIRGIQTIEELFTLIIFLLMYPSSTIVIG